MSIQLNNTISKSGELLTSEVGGELVMMDIESGKYFGVNKVGFAIWQLLKEPKTVNELCDELLKTYDIDKNTCQTEVLAFLSTLENERIIKVS